MSAISSEHESTPYLSCFGSQTKKRKLKEASFEPVNEHSMHSGKRYRGNDMGQGAGFEDEIDILGGDMS